MEVTFDSSNDDKINKLEFILAKYALDGSFLGFEELDDQLILCPHPYDAGDKFRKFGTNLIYDCSLDIETLITSPETVFYELFMKDITDEWLEIPVLIRNLVNSDNDEPNSGNSEGDWQLVRRFYLYDNVSGIETNNGYINGATPDVL